MPSIDQIKETLVEIKPTLASEYNVAELGVFGSRLKGTAHEDSDLDLFVSFSKPLGWKFFDLIDYLESSLKLRIDLVPKKYIRKELKEAILSEALVI